MRNCEGPAQDQQVFVTCFAFLKISKNTLNKPHGTRTGSVQLSYSDCPPETRIAHSKLHRARTVPAHDFYIQTSSNILKLYVRNCEGPAQDQQVFVTCFAFLKISKNTLNKLHGTRTGPVQLSYSDCPPETRIAHSKLHRTRTVPAHDFYIQTSSNVLKLYVRNCEGPAQDQQVFVILL